MSIWSLFFTAFLVGLSGAIMPGPLLTVDITETARRGFKAGPLLVLGHGILELALVMALATGLASVLARETVSGVIGVVGGAFLVYLGFGMVCEVYRGTIAISTVTSGDNTGRGINPVVAGAVVSLSNPYWSIWWATVGLGYIGMALKQGIAGVATFYTGHIMADAVWYLAVAGAVAGGRRFLSDRVYRTIIAICGVFLIGLGIYFIKYGIGNLR